MSDLESRLAEYLNTLPGVSWPTARLVSEALTPDARAGILHSVRLAQLVTQVVAEVSPNGEALMDAFKRITRLEAVDHSQVDGQIQSLLNLYEGLSDEVAKLRTMVQARGGKHG